MRSIDDINGKYFSAAKAPTFTAIFLTNEVFYYIFFRRPLARDGAGQLAPGQCAGAAPGAFSGKFYNSAHVVETYFVHASREDRDDQNDKDKYEADERKSFYHAATDKISLVKKPDLPGQPQPGHPLSAKRVTPWVSAWLPEKRCFRILFSSKWERLLAFPEMPKE